MEKETTTRPRRGDLLSACLWGTYLAGILLGAGNGGEELAFLTKTFLEMRRLGEWKSVFLTSAVSSMGVLSLLFVSGLCAVGQPVSAAVLFVRGMGLGGCIGELYRQAGFSGAAAALLLLALPETICAFCFLKAGSGAVRMSCRLFHMILEPQPVPLVPRFKRYSIRFIILFLLLILAAAVSGLCTGIFVLLAG
ncbi:MAG: stage II sporulation protein M [Oscillospiraceae bacterium]|nr:stage II sporulation protein M [Oscillospiraceae bacterium]